jgi:hypothetical protein
VLKSLDLQLTHLKKTGILREGINWELKDLTNKITGWGSQKAGIETLLPCLIVFALLPCLFLSGTGSPGPSIFLTFLFFNGFALLLFFLRLLTLSGGIVLLAVLFSALKGIESTLSTLPGMSFRKPLGLQGILLLPGFAVTLIPGLGFHPNLIQFIGVYFLGTIIFSILIPFSFTLFYTD